jgi:hypothetical protein
MTFQSNLDVWQDEILQSNWVRPLRAIDIVRLAASGAFGDIPMRTTATGGVDGDAVATLARAWRQIICRKIDWAAMRLAMARRATLEALKLLDEVGGRHARIELRGCVLREAEVTANASA